MAKKLDPVQSVKDWYHEWWLFSAQLKLMKRDGVEVMRGMRERYGLTQRQFAEALGIDFTYISKIENGAASMSLAMMKKLRKFIGDKEGERIGIE